jgi:hypothetical protein
MISVNETTLQNIDALIMEHFSSLPEFQVVTVNISDDANPPYFFVRTDLI